jgi:hypothetical protein
MTECTPTPLAFATLERRRVEADFSGGCALYGIMARFRAGIGAVIPLSVQATAPRTRRARRRPV